MPGRSETELHDRHRTLEELSGNTCKKDVKKILEVEFGEATPKKTPIRIYSVTKGISISFSLTCPDPSITLPFPASCNAKRLRHQSAKTCPSFSKIMLEIPPGYGIHFNLKGTPADKIFYEYPLSKRSLKGNTAH